MKFYEDAEDIFRSHKNEYEQAHTLKCMGDASKNPKVSCKFYKQALELLGSCKFNDSKEQHNRLAWLYKSMGDAKVKLFKRSEAGPLYHKAYSIFQNINNLDALKEIEKCFVNTETFRWYWLILKVIVLRRL